MNRLFMWQSIMCVCVSALLLTGCATTPVEPVQTTTSTDEVALKPIPVPARLAVEKAVEIALRADPRLGSRRAAQRLAQAEREDAWVWRDPQLRFEYQEIDGSEMTDLGRMTEEYEQYQYDLRVYPPNPFVASAREDRGDAAVSAATASLAAMEREIRVGVMSLFSQFFHAEDDLAVLKRLAKLEKKKRALLKNQSEAGHVTAEESLSAGLDYLEAVSRRDRRGRELDRIKTSLSQLLGGASLSKVKLVDSRDDSVDWGKLSDEDLVRAAMSHRQDLTVSEALVRVARAEFDEVDTQRIPWFAHIQAGISEQQRSNGNDTWSVRAAIEVPVFSWLSGADEVAAAGAEALEAQLQEMRATIRGQVLEAAAAVKLADRDLKRFRKETKILTNEIEDLLKEAASSDSVDPVLVLDLEKSLLEAKREALRYKSEYDLARIALEQAIGTSPDEL